MFRIRQIYDDILSVNKGGYRSRTLGSNARRFFQGLFAEMTK